MDYTIETKDDHYVLFTINRGEKRNAINYEVMDGLVKAIKDAENSDAKALVITGSGDHAFCSGGDLSVFHALKTKEEAISMLSRMANILYSLLTLSKPTLALLNGTAIGGGCELAAACDFRLARKGIKAGFLQGQQAITTGWGGGSILAEKLPPSSAMKLLMEAEVHPAEILEKLGFIDAFYSGDSIQACSRFLEKILSRHITVSQSYKKLWIKKWEENGLRARIETEVENCAELWESEAHYNYVNAFITKKLKNKE